MNSYKLLTPGPLTTTDTVKSEMMVDHCTWDDDYKNITQDIRRKLLELAQVSEEEYTVVLMQDSGTFGVESVLSSVIGDNEKVLICSNGAYGKRMTQICDRNRIAYTHYQQVFRVFPSLSAVGMSCLPAKARRVPFLWICWSSGTQWKRTENGDTPPPPMWFWRLRRH